MHDVAMDEKNHEVDDDKDFLENFRDFWIEFCI